MIQANEVQPTRLRIRHELAKFPLIMEQNPNTWWRSTAKMLIGFRHRLEAEPDLEVREYFNEYISQSLDMLWRVISLPDVFEGKIVKEAERMIMDLSMEMASWFEKENLPPKTHFLPLSELVKSKPDRLRIEEGKINGVACTILLVKHPANDTWQEIPLPIDNKIWHKGGPARTILEIVANAPLSMQQNEFPWHDFDVVIAGHDGETSAAIAIGVDPDGIEHMGEENLNFDRYCHGRDTQQNQVCLGAEGLYYSQSALMSAITGHVNIVGEYVANKAIYGIDRMTIHGISLAKQRGLMRLVKAVTEGKALSFDHLPLNSSFDMGVYILFLAKRWSRNEKLPKLLQKMYFLLRQMGQVREGEADIFQVLERAHLENPFFDFDSEVRFPIDVVRWKSRKIVKQIDREFAWRFGFPTTLDVQRDPGDDIPTRISLDGFTLNSNDLDIAERWKIFSIRSKKRTSEYKCADKTPYDRIFGDNFDLSDELGVGFDDLVLLDE